MVSVLLKSSLWRLIAQSDVVSWVVLLALLLMSLVCWTIFFYKIIIVRIKRRQLKMAFVRIESIKTMQDFMTVVSGCIGTLPGYFLSKNLSFIKMPLEKNQMLGVQTVTLAQWEVVQHHMYQVIDEMAHQEESYLTLFSTASTIGPLLGLFGTIWGLVQAFIGISEAQSADITAVAPGIAQALTTTLAGLIVAIPAAMMFGYLNTQARNIEQQLVNFADRVDLVMQRLLVG